MSIRRRHNSWHIRAALAALPLGLILCARPALAQTCTCPENAQVLPEDGAVGVPRNTLIWLSSELVAVQSARSPVQDSLEDEIRATTMLLAPDDEEIAYDITSIGRNIVLHPQRLLEPGTHRLRIWAGGETLAHASFTVDAHVDLEPSPPPTLTSDDDTPVDGFGGGGGKGGGGGQPAEPTPSWTPNCDSPTASPLYIRGVDPILFATIEGGAPLHPALQSGNVAASYFVQVDPEHAQPDHDWSGTSCFFTGSGEQILRAGSYDLAGNFSGYSDASHVVIEGVFPGTGGGFSEGIVGHGTGGDYCHVGSGGFCSVGGTEEPLDRDREPDCACRSAGADTRRSLVGGALATLTLALARRWRRRGVFL